MVRREVGRAIFETLPSQEHCKENQIWWALEENEKLPHTRKSIRQSYVSLYEARYRMTWGRLLPDEELKLAMEYAHAFDNRPESGSANCLLLGEVKWKRTDHDTSDSRPLREILRDKWLASEDFDGVRECSEFHKIMES